MRVVARTCPWALLDQGFRCLIAPSFADIFYNNCFQNGMLPVVLKADEVLAMMKTSCDARVSADRGP